MAAPPVSWLKGATNIASRATAPVDTAFFQHFDQLGVESQQLSGAEGNLNQAKQRFGECTARLKAHKDALAKNEAYAKEQRDRIQLVSKHWFYGTTALQPQLWLRGGTEGKISRAKTKLEKCERDHPGLVAQVVQVEQQELPPLQAAVSATQGAFQRKQDCDAERNNMRVAAVNANKTATLVQLQGQEAACGQAAEACQAQLQQLGSIAALCREGGGHYDKALELTKEAQRLNEAAQAEHNRLAAQPKPPPVNFHARAAQRLCPGCGLVVTWHPSHCCNKCAIEPGRHGPRCDQKKPDPAAAKAADPMAAAAAAAEAARARERAEQEKRDKKMREAQTEADKGAEVLRRAFASLPGPLRERYPQQCAAFAAVQMPLLAQTQAGTKMLEFFGGDKGNLFAEWQSGDQLRQNQALIQRCHGVCQSQQAVVHQLEAQVAQEKEAAKQQQKTAAEAWAAERRRIWEELRARATGTAPPPGAMPAAMPIGQVPLQAAMPAAMPMQGAVMPGPPMAPVMAHVPGAPMAVASPVPTQQQPPPPPQPPQQQYPPMGYAVQ